MLAVPPAIAAIIGGLIGTGLLWPALGSLALLVFPVAGSLSALTAGWFLHAGDFREADLDMGLPDPSEMADGLRALASKGRRVDETTAERKAG